MMYSSPQNNVQSSKSQKSMDKVISPAPFVIVVQMFINQFEAVGILKKLQRIHSLRIMTPTQIRVMKPYLLAALRSLWGSSYML